VGGEGPVTEGEEVLVEVAERVMWVTLNKPSRHNALSSQMFDAVIAAVAEGDGRSDVGCVVLRGAGPSFSSGFDFGEERGLTDDQSYVNSFDIPIMDDIRALSRGMHASGPDLWYSQTPVIAQVHGYCLAAALELACNCDLIVASDDAKFGYPLARSIVSPPSHMFTYLMGTQWTRYLLYTGDYIDGRTAASIGLALWSVAPAELADSCRRLAERIAGVPKELLAVHKSICEKALDMQGRPLMQRLAREAAAIGHKTSAVRDFFEAGRQGGFKAGLAAAERSNDGE
jgi:enoyl-CoA hydratase